MLTAGGTASSLRVCAAEMPPVVGDGALAARIAPELDRVFGAGWYQAEGAGDGHFRWAARESTLLLPLASPVALDLEMTLGAAHESGAGVAAAINGRSAGTCALAPGQRTDCRFRMPAEALRSGLNFLTLVVDRAVLPSPETVKREPRELAIALYGGRVRSVR
jgi:hypothetical protein